MTKEEYQNSKFSGKTSLQQNNLFFKLLFLTRMSISFYVINDFLGLTKYYLRRIIQMPLNKVKAGLF